YGDIGCGSSRNFDHDGAHTRRSVLRDYYPLCTQKAGAPEHCPKVLRVLYAVQDKKRFPVGKRFFQQGFKFSVGELRYSEDHSLVVRVARELRYALADAPGHGYPAFCCKLLDLLAS